MILAFLLLLVLTCWLLSAAGAPPPIPLSRLLVTAALLAAVMSTTRVVGRWWRVVGDSPPPRWPGRWLLGILVMALGVGAVGLDHELGGLYFADEGTYLAQAQRINGGQLLRGWFIYPHLLFYLDAVVLWAASLFSPWVEAAAGRLYGLPAHLVPALLTRAVTAALGAFTVVPVFLAGRRIAGDRAAVVAALLLALSPLFSGVILLHLSDVPGAFFAALTLVPVTALLTRERAVLYLAAGAAAGLAAGSKYPAGLVTVAVAGVWLSWRLGPRSTLPAEPGSGGRWGLLLAAAVAAAMFLLTTPSLLAFPRGAFGGGADLLFGARLYWKTGWPGVAHSSNALFYARELVVAFGVPALAGGLVGLLAVPRETRRRLLWLLPFPLVYLVLLLALKAAVTRTLMPVLPVVAIYLGVGWSALLEAFHRYRPRWRRVAMAVLVVALLVPATRVAGQRVRAARPTTRDEAARWISRHLPPGSALIQEAYTPELGDRGRFFLRRPRFAVRIPMSELADPRYDFLLLSSQAYGRFLRPDRAQREDITAPRERYRALFAAFPMVAEWRPRWLQAGPTLHLLSLDPEPRPFVERAVLGGGEALLAADRMRPPGTPEVAYGTPGDWSLFKAYLPAGPLRFEVAGDLVPGGRLRAVDRLGGMAVEAQVGADGSGRLELPEAAKYFLYVELPASSRLRTLTLEAG